MHSLISLTSVGLFMMLGDFEEVASGLLLGFEYEARREVDPFSRRPMIFLILRVRKDDVVGLNVKDFPSGELYGVFTLRDGRTIIVKSCKCGGSTKYASLCIEAPNGGRGCLEDYYWIELERIQMWGDDVVKFKYRVFEAKPHT